MVLIVKERMNTTNIFCFKLYAIYEISKQISKFPNFDNTLVNIIFNIDAYS